MAKTPTVTVKLDRKQVDELVRDLDIWKDLAGSQWRQVAIADLHQMADIAEHLAEVLAGPDEDEDG